MLRFRSLGSGSAGNALLIEASAGPGPAQAPGAPDEVTRVLVECGLGQRELQARLKAAGLAPGDLHAIFITHEHSDHVGCAPLLAERLGIPLWMSHGTWQAIGEPVAGGWVRFASDGMAIGLSEHCTLHPFTVPHDAREPLQLVASDGERRLGLCTDLGHASAHVVQSLQGCHALVLESNHDPDLLAASRYPAFLKRRVAGALGHLSNAAAAQLLAQLLHEDLRLVVAAHLSERNNRPELALGELQAAFGIFSPQLLAATAAQGCDWMQV
jgi:phosphoribosyl 1,2-cyclic phosphodiesterase